MGYLNWNGWQGVVAFTSDRKDGFSLAPYDSFNQAYHVGDNGEHVYQNRLKLCRDHGLSIEDLITTYQQHTTIMQKVTVQDRGAGATSFESGIGPCDGLYTFEKGLALGVFHADCVPVFLYEPQSGLVGIIHAGREGTLKRIVYEAIQTIIKQEGLQADNFYLHIGPSLSFQHHLIDEDAETFLARIGTEFSYGVKATNGKVFLDLPLLNVIQAREAGVPASHITIDEQCTYENPDRFYSYRRDGKTGRHLSVIFRR